MTTVEVPQLFALARDGEGADHIVGYGMVLPDGSTYSVTWSAGAGSRRNEYSASSAEQTAELCRAKVLWLGEAA